VRKRDDIIKYTCLPFVNTMSSCKIHLKQTSWTQRIQDKHVCIREADC